MHSVFVIGDVRTHNIEYQAKNGSQSAQKTIQGGSILMGCAIEKAIGSLDSKISPNVFSCDQLSNEPVLGNELRYWKLDNTGPAVSNDDLARSENGKEDRLRLQKTKEPLIMWPDQWVMPQVSRRLKAALAKFDGSKLRTTKNGDDLPLGYFETGFNDLSDGFLRCPWCPDLVVVDDMDAIFRQIVLSRSLRDIIEEAKHVNISIQQALKKGLHDKNWEDYENTLSNTIKSVPEDLWSLDAIKQFTGVVQVLTERLLYTALSFRRRPNPCMEPIIVASISGPLPQLTCSQDQKPTFWQCLAQVEQLRERTVVLLDVEDLRRGHELPPHIPELGISSGLSWERTAQETISELRRSKEYHTLLLFPTVIIRFGATGALQISSEDRTWSYRLFFDPHRDDREFSDFDMTNYVLGYSSVFAASLVEELTTKCSESEERPLLHDIPPATARAIPRALLRCQLLFEDGYGAPDEPVDVVLSNVADKLIFEDLFLNNDADDMPTLSQIEVPELRMPDWSILSQSVQGNMGQVARDIVRWGVEASLNRHVPTRQELVRVLAEECRIVVDEHEQVFADLVELDDADKVQRYFGGFARELDWAGAYAIARRVRLPQPLNEQCLNKETFWQALINLISDEIQRCKENDKKKMNFEEFAAFSARIYKWVLDHETCINSGFLNGIHESFAAPLLSYGENFTVVDRIEIEGIRAIHNLIKRYMDNINSGPKDLREKPLSLAVFGPPGSGKSTAVKSIITSLAQNVQLGDFTRTFNLAQYTNSEGLVSAFEEIATIRGNTGKVTVAFFDEFDAGLGNEQWGWLKFFLAPMEDGYFRGKSVHNSIFVFAGGTSQTYEQFSLVGRLTTDTQVQAFAAAKGPDFVSRLNGYLNVVGVNPASPRDELYLIRRAIIIRHFLVEIQKLASDEKARIDDDTLSAILFVPNYLNNTRSVRNMLEQCSQTQDRRVTRSSVPVIQQLAMLTDGKAFMDLLANVSSKKYF